MRKIYVIFCIILSFSSCSYKVPFGAEDATVINAQKNSDIDAVLDKQVTYPNGYGLTQKGFHWGW